MNKVDTSKARQRWPVTILAGFLGSGKTTLLNRILAGDHGVRFAVVVNDFGAVNIDVRLVESVERDAVNLSNGCVCCSMRGGLVSSVERLLDRATIPDHILVEASGISDPAGVAAAFRTARLKDSTRVDGVITLVDAAHVRDPRVDSQLAETQVLVADLVILNKADLVSESTRFELTHWIRKLKPSARIVSAVRADVPLEVLLGHADDSTHTLSAVYPPAAEPAHQDARFETWHCSTAIPLAYRRVRSMLECLPTSVFRSKGVLWLADAPNLRFSMQLVGSRIDIDVMSPWEGDETRQTDIVCIGAPDAISTAWLNEQLRGCITESLPLLSAEGLRAMRRRFGSESHAVIWNAEDRCPSASRRM